MTATPIVLVIDDNERTHILLQETMDNIGVQFVHAFTSDEGFEIIQKARPNLILLDLRLPAPSLSGWDIITQLKADADYQSIPIIAVTASGGESIMRAMKAGADDFIEKPFSLEQLRRKILRFVGLARS